MKYLITVSFACEIFDDLLIWRMLLLLSYRLSRTYCSPVYDMPFHQLSLTPNRTKQQLGQIQC